MAKTTTGKLEAFRPADAIGCNPTHAAVPACRRMCLDITGIKSLCAILASKRAWRLIHRSGDVPKYTASRAAVSRVIPRLPRIMSFTRPVGSSPIVL